MLRTIPRLARNPPLSRDFRTSIRSTSSRHLTQRFTPNPIYKYPSPSSSPIRNQWQTLYSRLFSTSHARLAEPAADAGTESLSLGQRMKKLGREYGWSGVGVYAGLCVIDLPICYMFVRTVGTDRIGEWEHTVVEAVKKVIPESVKTTWADWRSSMKSAEQELTGEEKLSECVDMTGWGVEEAEKKNKAEASLATQLALAYAIHKTFIFIRVPIAVAITPRVVKTLRGWGWDIGKRTSKEAKAINRAALPRNKKP